MTLSLLPNKAIIPKDMEGKSLVGQDCWNTNGSVKSRETPCASDDQRSQEPRRCVCFAKKKPAPFKVDEIGIENNNDNSSNRDSSSSGAPSPQEPILSVKTPVQTTSSLTQVVDLSGSAHSMVSSYSSSCQVRREKIVFSPLESHSLSKSQELNTNLSQNVSNSTLGLRKAMSSSIAIKGVDVLVQNHEISSKGSTTSGNCSPTRTTIGSDGEDDTSTDSSQEDENHVRETALSSQVTSGNETIRVYLPTVATELASSGYIKQAIDVFSEWIDSKAEPEDFRVFFNRCWCFYELDLYQEALADVEKVLQLNKTFSKGFYLKGKILMEMKQFIEAEAAFMTSYSLDGFPNGPLGEPTVQWIKKNIYFALLKEGYDAYIAGHISKTHMSIEEAKTFLECGGFTDLVIGMVRKKSQQKCEEIKKTGKIYPRSWFRIRMS